MDNDHAELGYIFHAFPSGSSLGYDHLDVFLVAEGLGQGFAPSQLTLYTWEQGAITKLALTAHWPGAEEINVAPGIVTILGHGGGEQTAYCFGGLLTCRRSDSRLNCQLTSSAPILNIGEEGLDWSENVVLRVVDSIESEIAAARAQSEGDVAANFEERLSHTDPRLLYAVGLTLAEHSFAQLPDLIRTDHYWDEYNTLIRALREVQQSDWWPGDPTLNAVLPALPH